MNVTFFIMQNVQELMIVFQPVCTL